jgi:hypothetical protein
VGAMWEPYESHVIAMWEPCGSHKGSGVMSEFVYAIRWRCYERVSPNW